MSESNQGDETQPPIGDVVVSAKQKRPKLSPKKLKPIVAGLVVLVLIIGVAWLIIDKSSNKVTTASTPPTVCSRALLKQAGIALQPGVQISTLIPIANQIQKLPGYQKDPNCLYVLVAYDINISDAPNATKNLNMLEKVYTPKQPLSVYLQSTKSIAILKSDIAVIEKNAKQNKLTLSRQP